MEATLYNAGFMHILFIRIYLAVEKNAVLNQENM